MVPRIAVMKALQRKSTTASAPRRNRAKTYKIFR
jgi:hypothetical protein